MKTFRLYANLLAYGFLLMLVSCKKPENEEETKDRMPPNVAATTIVEIVGDGIDSLPLVSNPVYDYAYNEPAFSKQ
jgi:hypothetical protein